MICIRYHQVCEEATRKDLSSIYQASISLFLDNSTQWIAVSDLSKLDISMHNFKHIATYNKKRLL